MVKFGKSVTATALAIAALGITNPARAAVLSSTIDTSKAPETSKPIDNDTKVHLATVFIAGEGAVLMYVPDDPANNTVPDPNPPKRPGCPASGNGYNSGGNNSQENSGGGSNGYSPTNIHSCVP